jgi:hypothetical protein
MGVHDRRRFRAFADFIHNTFPGHPRIADVAGGRGDLSYHLHELGLDSTIVDNRPARPSPWIHRALRKKSRAQGKLTQLARLVAKVEDIDLHDYDLIVGLHPDEATEHIVLSAVKHGRAFAVVPCCVFPLDGVKRSRQDWQDYLASLAPGTKTATLPINGANVVLYRFKATARA